jgi:putative transposase
MPAAKRVFTRKPRAPEGLGFERINVRLRDECLNENWFMNLKHARDIIEDWRRDYN